MKIGILGAGMIGGTLGALWRAAGHDVMISSRHPERLTPGEGVGVGTIEQAAAHGEAVLLAVPFGAPRDFAEEVKGALRGKVVLDANNAIARRDGAAAEEALAAGRGSGRWTASQLPGARVVKAFNTVYFRTMAEQRGRPDPVAVPLASDDEAALRIAAALVRDAGMAPVVVGGLDKAARFDAGTAVWNSSANAAELRAALGLTGG